MAWSSACADGDRRPEDVSCRQAHALIAEHADDEDLVIIDFRPRAIYRSGYLANAVFFDVFREDVDLWLDTLDRQGKYLIYCSVGHRSGIALAMMQDLGFGDVHHMYEGIRAWRALGYETRTVADDFGGEGPPGTEPRIFAPGVVSSAAYRELGCAISPDGSEFYFGRQMSEGEDPGYAIWVSRIVDGKWTAPQMLDFPGDYRDFAPFVTYDNAHLIFYRNAPRDGGSTYRSGTWIADRTAGGWSAPRFLVDRYCVTTADFRTFFFGFEGGDEKGRDIGRMTLRDGAFTDAVVLPGEANSPEWDAHPWISPGGDFFVFDSARPGGVDKYDMHISFRRDDGTWSAACNLGETINSTESGHRHLPAVSPDGSCLFFASEGEGDIWWVSLEGVLDTE